MFFWSTYFIYEGWPILVFKIVVIGQFNNFFKINDTELDQKSHFDNSDIIGCHTVKYRRDRFFFLFVCDILINMCNKRGKI